MISDPRTLLGQQGVSELKKFLFEVINYVSKDLSTYMTHKTLYVYDTDLICI